MKYVVQYDNDSRMERPAFWRVPRNDVNRPVYGKKRVHFSDTVSPGSCAQPELLRGDIITKIEDYDARDLRHEDAQMLFRNASNQIKIVVRRDDNIALKQCLSNESSRCPSTLPGTQTPEHASYPPEITNNQPHRVTPVPHGAHGWATALQDPTNTLPHTEFPHATPKWDPNDPTHIVTPGAPCVFPPPPPPRVFSPRLNRDYQDTQEEDVAISNQPYRTTPLILPGAKIKKDNLPTESYLRHHPNPAMRAPPQHDYTDVLMKQKVVHKQFNSPIGLYSQSNIENTIKSTVPNPGIQQQAPVTQTHTVPYKKTVVFDPLKSETYRALQDEEELNYQPPELPPSSVAQPKVFHPNRLVPGKKPTVASFPPPQPDFMKHVNSMGGSGEDIHQSHSFKRLMHHVLGETEY